MISSNGSLLLDVGRAYRLASLRRWSRHMARSRAMLIEINGSLTFRADHQRRLASRCCADCVLRLAPHGR